MDDETRPPACAPAAGRRRAPKAYSARLGRRICLRVAAGESLSAICEEAGMPHRGSLWRWTRASPRFAADLAAARRAGETSGRARSLAGYDPVAAVEICERLGEGQTLSAICGDPALPSLSTVHRWRRGFPEFAEMLRAAREVQAERLCDEGWDRARAVTPKTAFAAKVTLEHLRWMVGTLWPQRFRTRTVEPDMPRPRMDLAVRSFSLQVREDGAQRVVATCPDPVSGLPVRAPYGPWRKPVTEGEAEAYAERARGRPVLSMDDPDAAVERER